MEEYSRYSTVLPFFVLSIYRKNIQLMIERSDYMIKDLLSDDGEFIIFHGAYMECYIPAFYFDSKLGEIYGSDLRVFGIFNIRAFNDKMQPLELETFNFPSMLTLYPSETEHKKLTLLKDDEEPTEYIVGKFYKGGRVMRNAISQDSTNVELFINLITKGKIPRTVPYSQIIQIWHRNLSANNIKLGVVSSVLEAMIAQFYRDKSNPDKRFAQTIGNNPKVSETDYKPANIRELCARTSTFAALTFEDLDSMLTSSINISKYKKAEVDSPLEKILKM
jgi:hypothetical protein